MKRQNPRFRAANERVRLTAFLFRGFGGEGAGSGPDVQDAQPLMRQHHRSFMDAGHHDDGEISFSEFLNVLPLRVRQSQKPEDIKAWFSMIEGSNNGFVKRSDFVQWSLSAAALTANMGALAIFKAYDLRLCDGCLDEWEFTHFARDLGFSAEAHELFLEMSQDGALPYKLLLEELTNRRQHQTSPRSARMKECMVAFMWNAALDKHVLKEAPKLNLTSTAAWTFGGSPDSVRQSLAHILQEHNIGLVQLFEHLDDDCDTRVDRDEFIAAMGRLGFHGPPNVLAQIFERLDENDSGGITFDEFSAWVTDSPLSGRARKRALKHLSLRSRVCEDDEPWDEDRLRDELREGIERCGAHVDDLLEAWYGANKDGTLRKREWLQNWKRLIGSTNELWYDKIRGAVEDTFDSIAVEQDLAKNVTLSIANFARWIEPRRRSVSASASRRRPPVMRRISSGSSTVSITPSSFSTPQARRSAFDPESAIPAPPDSSEIRAIWRPSGRPPAWPLDHGLQRDKQRIAAQRPSPVHRLAPTPPAAHAASPGSQRDRTLGAPRALRICELHELPRVAEEAARIASQPHRAPPPPPDVLYISRKLNWPPKGIRVLRTERALRTPNVAYVKFGTSGLLSGRLAVQGGPPEHQGRRQTISPRSAGYVEHVQRAQLVYT